MRDKENVALNESMDPTDVTTLEFHYLVKKLRSYCYSRNLLECCVQHRKSYAAMCEDPKNVMTLKRKVNGGGSETIPAPQTGQMQLERELQYFIEQGNGELFKGSDPKCRGFFALNYSYRDEDHEHAVDCDCPRYRRQFPIFEVELCRDFEGLIEFLEGLLKHLGFPTEKAKRERWVDVARRLGVKDIDHEAEKRLGEETPIFFLTHFPLEKYEELPSTDPFWNMKRDPEDGRLSLKVDLLLCGQETMGCAERSCDVEDMRKRFFLQGNGEYHRLLFQIAGDGDLEKGKKKVMAELEDYWSRPFITRSGFGMGLFPRMIHAMRTLKLFPEDLVKVNLE